MTRRTKLLPVFALLGFGVSYLWGLHETREFAAEAGRHGAIALSSAVHLLVCVIGVFAMRMDRFSVSQ